MNPTSFDLSESDRWSLRTIVGIIARDLACLALDGTPERHARAKRSLALSWARLVELLTPAPGSVFSMRSARPVCVRARIGLSPAQVRSRLRASLTRR